MYVYTGVTVGEREFGYRNADAARISVDNSGAGAFEWREGRLRDQISSLKAEDIRLDAADLKGLSDRLVGRMAKKDVRLRKEYSFMPGPDEETILFAGETIAHLHVRMLIEQFAFIIDGQGFPYSELIRYRKEKLPAEREKLREEKQSLQVEYGDKLKRDSIINIRFSYLSRDGKKPARGQKQCYLRLDRRTAEWLAKAILKAASPDRPFGQSSSTSFVSDKRFLTDPKKIERLTGFHVGKKALRNKGATRKPTRKKAPRKKR